MQANRTLVAEVVVVLVAVGVLLQNLHVAGLTSNSTTWPTILLVLTGVVAIMLFVPAGGAKRAEDDDGAAQAPARDRRESARRYGMMGTYAVYVLALPYLGFGLATLLFVPIAAKLLGMPMTPKQIAVALATAIGVYLLFQVAFSVPLPAGIYDIPGRWF